MLEFNTVGSALLLVIMLLVAYVQYKQWRERGGNITICADVKDESGTLKDSIIIGGRVDIEVE